MPYRLAAERSRSSQESEKAVSELKADVDTLTPREQEVMARVTSGLSNKQVAAEIGVSEITVKVHRGNVTRKMGRQILCGTRANGGCVGNPTTQVAVNFILWCNVITPCDR